MPVTTRRWAIAPKWSGAVGEGIMLGQMAFWLKNKASGTTNLIIFEGIGGGASLAPASFGSTSTKAFEPFPANRATFFEEINGKAVSFNQLGGTHGTAGPSVSHTRLRIFEGLRPWGKTLFDKRLVSVKLLPKAQPGDFSTPDMGGAHWWGWCRIVDIEQAPLDPPDVPDPIPEDDDYSGYHFIPSVLPPEVRPRRISFEADVLFAFDSARIRADAEAELYKLTEELERRAHPKVKIIGHADSTGRMDYNEWLSLERAKAVRDWFVRKGAPNAPDYQALGKGESQPVAPNSTPAGRARNRRVEIEID